MVSSLDSMLATLHILFPYRQKSVGEMGRSNHPRPVRSKQASEGAFNTFQCISRSGDIFGASDAFSTLALLLLKSISSAIIVVCIYIYIHRHSAEQHTKSLGPGQLTMQQFPNEVHSVLHWQL